MHAQHHSHAAAAAAAPEASPAQPAVPVNSGPLPASAEQPAWHRVQAWDQRGPQPASSQHAHAHAHAHEDEDEDGDGDGDEWEYTEEEELITIDLGAFGNRLVRGGVECSLIGLETSNPHLRVGDRIFRGQWAEPIGTDIHLSIEKDPTRPPDQQQIVSPIPLAAPVPSTSKRRLILRPIIPPKPAPQAGPSSEPVEPGVIKPSGPLPAAEEPNTGANTDAGDSAAATTTATTIQGSDPTIAPMNLPTEGQLRTGTASVLTPFKDQDPTPSLTLQLSEKATKTLHTLATISKVKLVPNIQAALDKMRADSEISGRARIDHATLIAIAQAARSSTWALDSHDIDPAQLTLHALIRSAQLDFPPKPKFERSPELERSLAVIRLAQEREEYERMTSILNYSQKKRSLFSLAEPPMPNGSLPPSHTGPSLSVQKLTPEQEAQEWAEANKQISAVINIVISMAAVATAAWWAAGSASVIWKTLVCLALSIVVGIAETVMYARYWRVATKQTTNRAAKLTGFDAGKPPSLLSFSAQPPKQ